MPDGFRGRWGKKRRPHTALSLNHLQGRFREEKNLAAAAL